ncbi:MAG TPA: hypothetical protein VGQ36_12385 [Thermoanaerobaculia bacterium]|nr:hypothetical protein [Thermoanaerobaculia bacterium]
MIRRLILFAVLSLFAVPRAFAYAVQVYTFKSIAGVDYAQSAGGLRVKLCHATTGACSFNTTDPSGFANIIVNQSGDYYAYVWDSSQYEWGSSDQPDPNTYYVFPSFQQSIGLSALPRPLEPNLVAPCNGCGVGQGNFDLVWTNGLDYARTASNWPVTYDIYTSATPVGWPQGQEGLAISDAPCNPDAQGRCHWYVDFLESMPGCQYTWRIVVKINFGGGVIYETSGPQWHLHQNY